MRIEKNPGLGFSISGGISGQGNPFKPSDMVRPDPACQPITASPALPQSCHGNSCSLLQCFVYLSVCLSVCGAAVDLVNFESVILYYRQLEDGGLSEVHVFEGVKKLNLLKCWKSLLASPEHGTRLQRNDMRVWQSILLVLIVHTMHVYIMNHLFIYSYCVLITFLCLSDSCDNRLQYYRFLSMFVHDVLLQDMPNSFHHFYFWV